MTSTTSASRRLPAPVGRQVAGLGHLTVLPRRENTQASRIIPQHLLKLLSTPKEAAHDGAHRAAEDVGNFLVREFLEVREDDHHAEVDGKRVNGPQDVVGEQAVEEKPLRIARLVGCILAEEEGLDGFLRASTTWVPDTRPSMTLSSNIAPLAESCGPPVFAPRR